MLLPILPKQLLPRKPLPLLQMFLQKGMQSARRRKRKEKERVKVRKCQGKIKQRGLVFSFKCHQVVRMEAHVPICMKR